MRAYPTDGLNFLETVQVYFLEVTGRGVVLGSRDAELLQTWRAEGATAAVVCQGIDDAIRARGELPRSIAGCRKWIEPRVEAARAMRTGGHESSEVDGGQSPRRDWVSEVLERVEAAGQAEGRESFREAYRAAYRALRDGVESQDEFAQLVLSVDGDLGAAFWEALSDAERREIDDEIESSPQLAAMGEAARAAFIDARRRRELERRHGLITLFG